MSATTDAGSPVRGFQWAGGTSVVGGMQFDGAQGGQFGGTAIPPPPSRGLRQRGIAWGGGGPTPGAQWGAPGIAGFGGQWNGPADPSVYDLIETDGFALVLENPSGSERLAFSPDEPAYQSIKTLSYTSEVNKMASWQATVPANPEVFGWNFSRVTIAYDGERQFHGVLVNIEASQISDGELTLSGYGPLYWAGHGDITVRYSNMPAWLALRDLWLKVAQATDGQVRGDVVRPRQDHIDSHWISETGVEWQGTPAEVLQQAHGYAGMAFSFDHSEQAAVAQSFVPGEELRSVTWRAKSVKPAISVEGYHNQVTVIGAQRPNRPGRFTATATASQREIDLVMDGEIHNRTEREFDLESEQACRARAETLLKEDRGEYTVGGSLAVTPSRDVVPGYTYRIEEFDGYVPQIFSPVWCSLRSVQHSYGPDEATVSLSFDDESRLVEHIRHDLMPDTAPMSIKRRDAQLGQADPNNSMHERVVYASDGRLKTTAFNESEIAIQPNEPTMPFDGYLWIDTNP